MAKHETKLESSVFDFLLACTTILRAFTRSDTGYFNESTGKHLNVSQPFPEIAN